MISSHCITILDFFRSKQIYYEKESGGGRGAICSFNRGGDNAITDDYWLAEPEVTTTLFIHKTRLLLPAID